MPRRSQCVFGCQQFDVLHRFPIPETSLERFLQWKDIVGPKLQDKTNEDIYTNYRICNHHFEGRYCYPHSKRLARTAYPTLKLGSSASSSQDVSIEIPQTLPESMDIHSVPQTLPGCSAHVPNLDLTNKTGNASKGKQTKRIKIMMKKVINLKNKLKEQKNQVKAAQKMSRTKLFNKVMKSLPVPTQLFLNMQLTQHSKKNRGRRFSLQDKLLALSMYKKSPKGYYFLRKLFALPSKRTLQDVLKKITLKPGVNSVIFDQMKDTTEKLTTEQRLCVLMFDEMAISPSMHFDLPSDQIIGFEDMGSVRTENIADHVLVLMVKGIKKNYKQPLFYGFCRSATKTVILKSILKSVIEKLFQTGLIVVATVCDQSSTNSKVVHDLIAETRGEYLRENREFKYNAFKINGHKIFPLFDAPHLLKCIRNNFLKKELRFTQDGKIKTAKWEHLKMLLDLDDGEDELRMCNKLTEAHVLPDKIPKMKVKHAAQVFSQRVSGALRFCTKKNLLPQECEDTADILLLFDQLFDSFNGGSYKKSYKIYKNALQPNSEHFAFWNKSVPILRSMGFKTETKKKGVVTISYEKVPSIKNWIHNIHTMKDLWHCLSKEYGITSLIARNLNQDPVENFFSSVRSHGARNINPTCLQFESVYKTLLINNLCSNHSLGANCEEDSNEILHNLDYLLLKNPPQPSGSNEVIENSTPDMLTGSSSENELVLETKKYVAGFVIKRIKINICKSCHICNNELCDTTPPQADNYILAIDITRKSLQYPSVNFVHCVTNIIKIIKNYLQHYPQESGITKKIKIAIQNTVNFDFLSCDEHQEKVKTYVSNLLIKIIINSWCNNVNKILKGRHVRNIDDKIKTQALEYYKTHRKSK